MRRAIIGVSTFLLVAVGCTPLNGEADWPPLAKKWFDRAQASFHQVDIEDAELAIGNAVRLQPEREEVRVLAARIALAGQEYDAAIQHVEGLQSQDALVIRGRAHWYAGRVDQAADELERLLADPEVRDPWARDVAKLARRGGGREPFRMTGDRLAVMEMPFVGNNALIVPVELDGEPALALIATGEGEVVIDSSSGREPAWVSLRFDGRVEVKDVPALTGDLSRLSRRFNAPIKLLLGNNLLRHLNPTIDHRGGQFVVRRFEPPPPPSSTTVQLAYILGDGMVLRSAFGADQTKVGSFWVDTSQPHAVYLDDSGWAKAGVAQSALLPLPNGSGERYGVVPLLQVGAFSIPEVQAVRDGALGDLEKRLGVDLDGRLGAGMVGAFRVTLIDGGRAMWLEDAPIRNTPPPDAAPEPADPEPQSAEPPAIQPSG